MKPSNNPTRNIVYRALHSKCVLTCPKLIGYTEKKVQFFGLVILKSHLTSEIANSPNVKSHLTLEIATSPNVKSHLTSEIATSPNVKSHLTLEIATSANVMLLAIG